MNLPKMSNTLSLERYIQLYYRHVESKYSAVLLTELV